MTMPRVYASKGTVTPFGYRRIRVRGTRKSRMEHVLIWERHCGPVPAGMELHHINGNKLDNRIENLQLVTRLEHKRIHSGCVLRDGEWWKPCRSCNVFHPVTNYYRNPEGGIQSVCRGCAIRRAIENKKRRRLARMAAERPHVEVGCRGSEFVRFTLEEVNAGRAAEWALVAGWFAYQQTYWAWFKREVSTDG